MSINSHGMREIDFDSERKTLHYSRNGCSHGLGGVIKLKRLETILTDYFLCKLSLYDGTFRYMTLRENESVEFDNTNVEG